MPLSSYIVRLLWVPVVETTGLTDAPLRRMVGRGRPVRLTARVVLDRDSGAPSGLMTGNPSEHEAKTVA